MLNPCRLLLVRPSQDWKPTKANQIPEGDCTVMWISDDVFHDEQEAKELRDHANELQLEGIEGWFGRHWTVLIHAVDAINLGTQVHFDEGAKLWSVN